MNPNAQNAAVSRLSALSLCAVAQGFWRRWLSPTDVIEHAVNLLVEGSEDESVILLAGGEDMDTDEMQRYLYAAAGTGCDERLAFDQLRLLFLSRLQAREMSEDDKIAALQLLYAKFHYPEDMRACSIYGGIIGDPLVAMNDLIAALRAR